MMNVMELTPEMVNYKARVQKNTDNTSLIVKSKEKINHFRTESDSHSIVKGGEKGMVSEWEELEKLSKEELIIELVRARTCYRGLRGEISKEKVWPWPEDLRDEIHTDYENGQKTTESWAERIALYGAMHPMDGSFYWCDLENYGLDRDQAFDVVKKLYNSGKLKVPKGVIIGDMEGY